MKRCKREIKFRARWKDTKKEVVDFMDYGLRAFEDEAFLIDQFTGFKDLSGKDIYENDLVSFSPDCVGIMIMDKGAFRAVDFQIGLRLPYFDYSDCVVVGNIYDTNIHEVAPMVIVPQEEIDYYDDEFYLTETT